MKAGPINSPFGCLCAIFQHHASFEQQKQLRRIALHIGAALFCISIALVVYSCATQPVLCLSHLLGTLPLRALGFISYSLYLWQQIWMTPAFHVSLPAALAGALARGTASYWLVENTGLKLRQQIQQWTDDTR